MGWAEEDAMRMTLSAIAMFSFLVSTPGSVLAKSKAADVEADPPPAATPLNECGCYRDAQDQCHCNKTKKLKCDCDNDCMPAACEAQRAKQQEKDAAAALKRIQQNDKKQQAASKAAMAKQAKDKAAAEKAKKAKDGEGRWK
jgi:hypothetical protein